MNESASPLRAPAHLMLRFFVLCRPGVKLRLPNVIVTMKKQSYRMRIAAFGLVFAGILSGCKTLGKEQTFGTTLTGIDHLANQLSVSDFSVNGTGGFQAGKGGSFVCCVVMPDKWYPGLTAHVKWVVSDWRDHVNGGKYEADVPVDRYAEHGQVWVHFMADGTVRVVVSNDGPYSPLYPGPHDPIPRKEPWKEYPQPWIDERPLSERLKSLDQQQ